MTGSATICFGAAMLCAGPVAQEPTEFALNVSRHVLFHEAAHALIREFDLPILGNEETMADAFATVAIASGMRENAAQIVGDRARSWLIEAAEVPLEKQDLMGEHELDARRAYRTVCLLHGVDPSKWSEMAEQIGLDRHDADECSDIAPDVIDGWQSVLDPHFRPDRTPSEMVIVRYGEAPHTATVREAGILEEVADLMRMFDWPDPVILHFDSCGREGSSWNRTERRILFCDEYFQRFLRQAEKLEHAASESGF